jgi:hypothetical protein
MFVILWQFDIAEDKLAAFEESYGPAGKWAQLFRASSEYYGTELLRDQHVPGRFVTVDRWSSLVITTPTMRRWIAHPTP